MRNTIRIDRPIRGARLLESPGDSATLDVVVANEREKARELGRLEGRQLELEETAGRLTEAIAKMESERENAQNELASVSVELALSIASTLLRREIAEGNHDIERIVRETLAEANVGRSSCVVHLNPADYARIADAPFRSGTTIQADDGVPLGDVHVETSLGLLVRESLGALDRIRLQLEDELQ